MSPKSDNHSNGPPTGRPPGSDINVDEFKVTELFDKIMTLDKSMFSVEKDDVEQHIPFDSSCYPDGENSSLHMSSHSPPPRNRTHDRKHHKKKLEWYFGQTKFKKVNLILPLPDC